MELGFVLTRHVNSEKTNKYWNECYTCIRKFYPTNTVIIIDDNSKYEYITPLPYTPPLTNVFFIQSEFQGRGELLPYYYLNKYKLFPKAIIIHDSVFIQQPINLETSTTSTEVKLIWNFQHFWEKPPNPDLTNDIKYLISKLNPQHTQRLLELYEKKDQWTGCFGVMSIINTEYISTTLDQTYHFFNLLEHVTTRTHRCCLERVFGLICADLLQTPAPTLLGDIHHYINQYCNWEYDFDQYMNDKNNMKLQKFPMIKAHSGR